MATSKKELPSIRDSFYKNRKRAFNSETEYRTAFLDYNDGCRLLSRMTSVPGFCAVNNITKKEFESYKILYPDTYDFIENILEDNALNATDRNLGIFYLKSKCGYSEAQQSLPDIDDSISVEEYLKKSGGIGY